MNDSINHIRLQELFDAACELGAGERAAFVARACGDDSALHAELQRWLAADAQMGDFLETSPRVIADNMHIAQAMPRFGPWLAVRLLGAGGMGEVWLAERADGAFEQRVAVKQVMLAGAAWRERFLAERRILALLQHPNIARLIDGGVDGRGLPYLVMEYVGGATITEHARDHALDVAARIALFLPVVDAVQYAHGRLVIHRDIKPANVLVDGNGTAKLLDFGIAKLLDDDDAVSTRTGLRLLTPEYASPEQARGEIVGTASDIYSLGILLYELITGVRPYEILDASPSSIERTICNTEPLRPSVHVAAARRAVGTRDLDAVVLKALAKDPAERYASCAEFASDLRRWQRGESVLARVPSTSERVQRYVRRHAFGVGVAAAVGAAFIVGLVAVLYFYRQSVLQREVAIHERNLAEQQTAVAAAVKDFLDQDLIRLASPYFKTSAPDVTVREAVDRGAARVQARFAGKPALETEVRNELGNLYTQLAQFPKAEEQFRSALASSGQTQYADPGRALAARFGLSFALIQQGKLDEAKAELQKADLAFDARQSGTRLSGLRNQAWGTYYYNLGQLQNAEPYLEHSLFDLMQAEPENALLLAVRKGNLANVYVANGRVADAERLAAENRATLDSQGQAQTFAYGMAMTTQARIGLFRHDYAQAETLAAQAAVLLHSVAGQDTPFTGDALWIVLRAQLATGRYAEAEAIAHRVYDVHLAVVGARAFTTQVHRIYLGQSEWLNDRRDEGLRDEEEGIEALLALVPADHLALHLARFLVAGDALDAGGAHVDTARPLLASIDIDALQRISPEGDWPARMDALRGQLALYDGDEARARTLLDSALERMRSAHCARFEIERVERALARMQ